MSHYEPTPQSAPSGVSKALAGKSILVVEDEPLVVMMLEDVLSDAGAKIVGPALRLADALALAEGEQIDAALLDINLNGVHSFPVAAVLQRRGIPFVFATGYGEMLRAEPFNTVTYVRKPFQEEQVAAALARLFAAT